MYYYDTILILLLLVIFTNHASPGGAMPRYFTKYVYFERNYGKRATRRRVRFRIAKRNTHTHTQKSVRAKPLFYNSLVHVSDRRRRPKRNRSESIPEHCRRRRLRVLPTSRAPVRGMQVRPPHRACPIAPPTQGVEVSFAVALRARDEPSPSAAAVDAR